MTEIKLKIGDVVELSTGDIAMITYYFKDSQTYGINTGLWRENGEPLQNYTPRIVRVLGNIISSR